VFEAAAPVNSQTEEAALLTLAAAKACEETELPDIVPYCSRYLGLKGLACLAASSQQYKETCLQTACSDATHLLVDAINAAAAQQQDAESTSLTGCKKETHIQAVAWLLRITPEAAMTATAAQHLLCLPSVPLHLAKEFVKAGVRINFKQLQAAAHEMVAGVEVWVQAQQQLGVVTDIPMAAVALCCTEANPRTG
jgi:hypothetical protein